MSVPSGPAPPPEWYLARDGEQFGPLSDPELRKLVEFGHLKPSDLLWREGFPEWRSARILLAEAQSAAQAEQGAATVRNHQAQPQPTPAPVPLQAPVQAPQAASAAPTRAVEPTAHSPGPSAPAVRSEPVPTAAPAPSYRSEPYRAPPTVTAPMPAPVSAPYQPAMAAGPHPGPHAPMPARVPNPQPVAPQGSHPVAPSTMQPVTQPIGRAPHAASQPMAYQAAPGAGYAPQSSNAVPPSAAAAHRPMDLARPGPAAPVAQARRATQAAPVHRHDVDEDDEFDDDASDGGSRTALWLKRIAVLLFFVLTLSAAGWYAYPHRDRIAAALNLSSLQLPNVPMPSLGGATQSPVKGFAPTIEATEAALQKSLLWRVLKRDFPEWYAERSKEATAMAAAQKSEAEIGQAMMEQIVALRRKHAGDALSATMPYLRTLAIAFADNLERLRKIGVEPCHGFISKGEVSGDYLRLLAEPSHSTALQAQLVAVFDAIADGRKVPRVYPQPRQADYNLLVTALEARGWTEAELQLFSDSRRFGQAPPERVCSMVTDWFRAHIDVKEQDAQLRLLADALKPVVAG